ncbi:MAG: DNA primase [Actinobacteria bacterium]|nr:DNA primase [Micrococcales bacterium]MCB0902679.1 DNA primase [Actinomycetota bacterium]MCO5301468.1 DNA primase [Candidatus Nanopelagicales bacterium]MCB9429952.1 DNA primase [Actinomycetota bacterium]HPJ18598.1 DNA primase [Actinomycetota bacterium]
MARILAEDIALVRDRARIDEVISDQVTLKPAGGGSLKGLCPFHDERSPSFHVTPAKGFYHCFGCQAGGDVIDFVMKTDMVTFAEAVEKLAARFGVTLRYAEGGPSRTGQQGQRTRLIEANTAAAKFFREALSSPQAQPAREFLAQRHLDSEAADVFAVGFALPGWDNLVKRLRAAGFTDDEMVTSGLALRGNRGPYDRFRGRIVWPIRDLSGEVVGFGARRIMPDDDGPKYLNTPETPVYHKSQILYGVDLARKQIARSQQVVVVEGYTDVMACHLAGVDTAVATCGTAFGEEHVKVLRRLLLDQDEHRGEVIFTFDSDEAGRKAALRAFDVDQKFVGQTFVAVTGQGMDPCDLRIASGDEAVRDLVSGRIPLVEFVIRSKIDGFDLDSAEGRTNALRAAAPVIGSIPDRILRSEYVRRMAGWTGVDQSMVSEAVRQASRGAKPSSRPADPAPVPDERDPAALVERESLKLALQSPELVHSWFSSVQPAAFTGQMYAQVYAAVTAAGGPPAEPDEQWIARVLEHCPDDSVRTAVRALAVESPRALFGNTDTKVNGKFAVNVLSRLLELDAGRRLREVKSKLQRINPIESDAEYRRLFADVLALEQYRRDLREVLVGGM